MELTDRHIQYAQQLAKIQFSTIGGLCSTLLQNKSHNYLPHNSVQVIFCNSRSHWIMISNMNCNKEVVNVYDSLFKVLDDETMDVIKNYFGTESKKEAEGKVQYGRRTNIRGVERPWIICHSISHLPCI